MPSEEAYTRRISAILLADVTGFSALVGKDDERTARAVEQLQNAVRAIVVDAKGYADTRAGDAIFASFDSVVTAVQAALTIQRRVGEAEFEGQRLQVRIGVHFGDVLVREGTTMGEGVGDAINIAARLQTLARPGTVCISEGVYLQVRNRCDERFIDLGKQQLKNIPYPVHAYLVIPSGQADQRVRPLRRSAATRGVLAALLAILVLAAALLIRRQQSSSHEQSTGATTRSAAGAGAARGGPARPAADAAADAAGEGKQIALGVMVFKSLAGDGEGDWRREALRDGLNTQLSQLSRVKVYSKEFIDFLISRQGLTDIEAATKLGISKMLSGSFVVTSGTIRIETHVVDVKTGVLESSHTTVGREADFLNLQNQLVFGVISRLDLPVTAEEKQQLLAQQTTDEEALKMLLEAEGGVVPPPAAGGQERSSALSQWLARLQRLALAVALADDTDARGAILEALERYRRAMENRDLQELSAVYADFPAEQQAAQQRYFANVRDLKISIENPEIAVVGDEAVVSYTRNDNFVDARTGRPMHVTVRLTKILRHADGAWKMAAK